MTGRLLELSQLADADVEEYWLVRFEGREAISSCFDYSLEIVTAQAPNVSAWVGKVVAWSVRPSMDSPRGFAGQIHEASLNSDGSDHNSIHLRVRPVFFGAAFTGGLSFYQDRNAIQILDDLTKSLPDLVVAKAPLNAPKRAYAVKYEESDLSFLTRLLAQDGTMYFFVHDPTAGTFQHKLVLAGSTSAYQDVPNAEGIDFGLANSRNSITSLHHTHLTRAHKQGYGAAVIDEVDAVAVSKSDLMSMGRTFEARQREILGGLASIGDLPLRSQPIDERREQEGDHISGSSSLPHLFPTGRIPNASGASPGKLVIVSVTHSASAPFSGGPGYYHNSFEAMDAVQVYRAPVPSARRRAPGPVLATVSLEGAVEGQIEVDTRFRIPVMVAHAHPRPMQLWLPMQQTWAQSAYGAQFVPRIGTQVVVDFLYGDPDLPFVSGCFYTPNRPYPFDLPAQTTRSGWRSKTEKNGAVAQEIMFEDKDGGEEIHLYTGRNFRRQVDKDELTTINENNVTTVKKDQTLKVVGQQDVTIEKTQTVTVTDAALFESKKEIKLKVGENTITIDQSGITIKAMKIQIKSETTIDVEAGGKLQQKAPMVQINGDATIVIQGGLVKIN